MTSEFCWEPQQGPTAPSGEPGDASVYLERKVTARPAAGKVRAVESGPSGSGRSTLDLDSNKF